MWNGLAKFATSKDMDGERRCINWRVNSQRLHPYGIGFFARSLSLQFPYGYNVIVWILLHQSATIAMSMKWHTYSILSPHLPSTRSQTYTSAEQSSTTLVFFIGHANTFNASQTSAIQNCTESFTMVIYEIFLQHSSTRTMKYTARIVELNYLL